MKRCAAPCVGRVGAEAYAELVHGTALFLRGRSRQLLDDLRGRMESAAAAERFEEAARLRDRVAAVERTIERQQIVSDRPVSTATSSGSRGAAARSRCRRSHVRDGRVVGSSNHSFSAVELDDASRARARSWASTTRAAAPTSRPRS